MTAEEIAERLRNYWVYRQDYIASRQVMEKSATLIETQAAEIARMQEALMRISSGRSSVTECSTIARAALPLHIWGGKTVSEWQPIETAPEAKGKYFFCHLAWGPDWDKCTGNGFRWEGRWFVGAIFHKPNARFDECQYEIRQIEVQPTHWMPLPTPPQEPTP